MAIKVEQINKNGIVINDFDKKLSTKKILKILNSTKLLKIENNKNPFKAVYKKKEINILIKNISHLGNPHPIYKKRIQIPKEWKEILQKDSTILIGVYHYDNKTTFCIFNTNTYKNNKVNNSAAHIHTIDLYKAKEFGIFKKTDSRNNNLTVFTFENFEHAFDEYLFNKALSKSNEINLFQEFAKTLNKDWNGIDCYKEMIGANFNNAYQPEWAGFYLEYVFNNFLDTNQSYKKYCQFISNKTKDSIDLDLWFDDQKFFGDLKTHTIGGAILGNDKNSFHSALNKYNKIWYIAFSHNTKKDKDYKGVVTKFWNKELNLRDGKNKKLDSYLNKMKNSIELENFSILEINHFNKQYLSDFKQGVNSNNQSRKYKIKINKKDINNDNFAIYRQKI
jgi:hypothetical protein